MWSCMGKQVPTEAMMRQDKRLAVGRLGALVEQIEALVSRDVQVILVRFPSLVWWWSMLHFVAL